MTHPNCDHSCTSECRRSGCNCLCGEFHDSMTQDEVLEAVKGDLWETRVDTVKMLTRMFVQGNDAHKLACNIVDALFPDQDEIQENTTSMEEKLEELDPVAVNVLTERN